MDSRASTSAGVGAVPVFLALLFNLVVPMLAVTAPHATPTALRPQVAEAASDRVPESLTGESSADLRVAKVADHEPIDAGEVASYHLYVWNAGPGTAVDVFVEDVLPPGLSWSVEHQSDHDPVTCESSADSSGSLGYSCTYADLAPSSMEDGIVWHISAQTDPTDCGVLHNDASAEASNDGEVSAGADITVECPTITLVVDKVADTEVIIISGPNGALVADPSVVTWTLTYTLANGPFTNAVITDEVPVGFEFLDASDGGELVDGVVTWTFPTLTESGSVTFRTTVDPETISRVAPTLNVAAIDSDETAPDAGEDAVTVEVVPPPQGGNPTPGASMPDTAVVTGPNGEPITLPVELQVGLFLGSLGAMALANVTARSRRR